MKQNHIYISHRFMRLWHLVSCSPCNQPLIPLQYFSYLLKHCTNSGCCYCFTAKSCLTLCDPMYCSLPDSFVHGIEHWNGLLFPFPGDLPNPGIESASPALAGRFLITAPPGHQPRCNRILIFLSASDFSYSPCTVWYECPSNGNLHTCVWRI